MINYLKLLIGFLLATPSVALAEPPTLDRKELTEPIRQESDSYLAAMRSYQWEMSSVTSFRGTDKQEPWSPARHKCRQRGQSNLVVTTFEPPTGVEPDRAIAVNAKYAFELHRSPGKSWVLAKFHDLAKGPLPKGFRLGEDNDQVARMATPYYLDDGRWLPDLLRREDFTIQQIEATNGPTGKRYTVKYEFRDPDRREMVHSGSFTINPENRWIIEGYDHRSTIKGITRRSIRANEFTFVDGLPLLKKSVTTVSSDMPRAAGIVRETVSTTLFTKEQADEYEFTLSAFGLPEPPGVDWKRPTPRYVWLLVATGVLGAMAIALRMLARRRAAKVPA